MLLLAEGATTPLTVSDFQSLFDQLKGLIPVSSVVGVIGAILGITVAFGFMWWGARFGIRKIMGSIKKGKVG